MRFKKYLTEAQEYKIYVDMDGVLTDFDGQFRKMFGKSTDDVHKEGDDAHFWKIIDGGGLKFWSEMPWLKGSRKFWNFVKQFKPTILSAPARSLPNSPKGKKIWVKRELGGVPLILKRARDKKDYADKNSILIDDMTKNISDWKGAGGIAIRFKSPEQAMKELKEILGK